MSNIKGRMQEDVVKLETKCGQPDFNDIKSVEEYFTNFANTMLDCKQENVKATGLCMKSVLVGLVAFLADAKRQEVCTHYQVNALFNVFAQISATMVLALSHDKDEAGHLAHMFSELFVMAFTKAIAEVTGDESIDFMKFRAKKQAERDGMANAIGFLPDNGTVH